MHACVYLCLCLCLCLCVCVCVRVCVYVSVNRRRSMIHSKKYNTRMQMIRLGNTMNVSLEPRSFYLILLFDAMA
jgi:hypothetical protein